MENKKYCICGGEIIEDEEPYCGKCGLVDDREPLMPEGGKSLPLGSVIDGLGPQDWERVTTFKKDLKDLHEKVSGFPDIPEKKTVYIESIATQLGLGKEIREAAYIIFGRAMEKNLHKGYGFETLSMAIVFNACKQQNLPRPMDEIVNAVIPTNRYYETSDGKLYRRRMKASAFRCSNVLKKELNILTPPTRARDYIERFSTSLGLDQNVRTTSMKILEKYDLTGLPDSPKSQALAVLYLANLLNDGRATQKEIARTCDLTEVAIRNNFKRLADRLNLPDGPWIYRYHVKGGSSAYDLKIDKFLETLLK